MPSCNGVLTESLNYFPTIELNDRLSFHGLVHINGLNNSNGAFLNLIFSNNPNINVTAAQSVLKSNFHIFSEIDVI